MKAKDIIQTFPTLPYRMEVRSAFYVLPLFVTWLIGVTYEKNGTAYQSAKRGMVLFYLFVFFMALIYIISNLLTGLAPNSRIVAGLLSFSLHSIIAIIYIFLSLFLAFMELRKKNIQISFLDKIAAKIETYLGK